MPTARINGLELFYELDGVGEVPLVLVHGSWVSHTSWAPVVPQLTKSFRVLAYDRRGHSRSERPAAPGSIRDNVADLAALIEQLGLAPAWVVASSFGGSIALRLASERPDLLRGVLAHEPPLLSLLAGNAELEETLRHVEARLESVLERIASGDHAGAAEAFTESVALGPGAWAQLPPQLKQTFIENAPTFLDESLDPEQLVFDPMWLRGFDRPCLLSTGDQSPPLFPAIVRTLAGALPGVRSFTFAGAGHVPHTTHPDTYVEVVRGFTRGRLP